MSEAEQLAGTAKALGMTEEDLKKAIDSVAEDLGIPVAEVRERASALAPSYVLAKLRASLGKERVHDAREGDEPEGGWEADITHHHPHPITPPGKEEY